MASKDINVKRQNCNRCKLYAPPEKWEVGHYYCSAHRDCTGKSEWCPELCEICQDFKSKFTSLSGGEQHTAIKNLRAMLQRTAKGRSRRDNPWKYSDKVKETYSEYFPDHDMGSSPSSDLQNRSQHSQDTPTLDQQQIQVSPEQAFSEATQNEFVQPYEVMDTVAPQPQAQWSVHPDLMEIMGNMISSFKESVTSLSQDISSKIEGLTVETKGHQSRLEKFLSRKRAISSSSDPSTPSESSQSRSSSRFSHSRSPSPSPVKRSSSAPSGSKEAGDDIYFIEDGYTWLYINRRTEVVGSKVKIGGTLTQVKWHPTKQAFRTVSETVDDESPFMSIPQSLDTLAGFFVTQHDTRDKLGPSNRSYRGQISDDSNFHHMMKILINSAPMAMDALYRDDRKALESSFPVSAFDPVSVINFTSGWTFTTEKDFSKIAKGELDIKEASSHLKLKYSINVPKKYLSEEKAARMRLIEFISSIGALDGIIKKVEDPVVVEALKATARHFLSFLKDFTKSWYSAKFAVRRIALQYSESPSAMQLLCSNMWEAPLFAVEASKAFVDKDIWGYGTEARLLLSRATNSAYGRRPQLADPSHQKRRERSRSTSPRRPVSRRRRQSFQEQPSYSYVPHASRNKQSSRQRKGPYKKPKVSFRNQETKKDSKASGSSKFYKNKFKKQ